jgi:hypothetical protein
MSWQRGRRRPIIDDWGMSDPEKQKALITQGFLLKTVSWRRVSPPE